MCAIDDLEAFPRSVLILENGPTSSKFPVGLEDNVASAREWTNADQFRARSNRNAMNVR